MELILAAQRRASCWRAAAAASWNQTPCNVHGAARHADIGKLLNVVFPEVAATLSPVAPADVEALPFRFSIKSSNAECIIYERGKGLSWFIVALCFSV